MARISTYSVDKTLEKTDKLLGSNLGGATRNFTLEDVTTYLSSVGVAGKITYMFTDNDYNGNPTQIAGQMIVPGNDNATFNFSSLTTVRVSKFPFGTDKGSILERLQQLKNENVIISNINDLNQFALFNVTDISQEGSTDFYNLTLEATYGSSLIHNGVLENLKYYSIDVYKSDKRYTHNQVSASATWTINHNLGKFPSVTIKFSTGATYSNVGAFAGVQFIDENNLTINLAAAESGYAYLN